MSNSRDNWQRYLGAAQRKIDIADYHAEGLRQELAAAGKPTKTAPPIPVQAHFEGVVVSIMATVDQVAQAVNSALRLGLGSGRLIEGAFGALSEAQPDVRSWFEEPIGRDLRNIRVRIVHHSYAKTPRGLCWTVESANRNYDGPRDLLGYAENAVEYGERLRALLPIIEAELTDRQYSE